MGRLKCNRKRQTLSTCVTSLLTFILTNRNKLLFITNLFNSLLTCNNKLISNSNIVLLTLMLLKQLKNIQFTIGCGTCAIVKQIQQWVAFCHPYCLWWCEQQSAACIALVIVWKLDLGYCHSPLGVCWFLFLQSSHTTFFIPISTKAQTTSTLLTKFKMLTHSPEIPRFSHLGSSSTMKKFSCFSYSSTFIMRTCNVWLEIWKNARTHTPAHTQTQQWTHALLFLWLKNPMLLNMMKDKFQQYRLLLHLERFHQPSKSHHKLKWLK